MTHHLIELSLGTTKCAKVLFALGRTILVLIVCVNQKCCDKPSITWEES